MASPAWQDIYSFDIEIVKDMGGWMDGHRNENGKTLYYITNWGSKSGQMIIEWYIE